MRAVVIDRPGPADVLLVGELRAPHPGPGQVVVDVEVVGVNPVDVGNRSDNAWAGVSCPYVVGYEFSGVVIEIGDGKSDLRIGDAVWGLLPVRNTRWGAYAERVAVDASHLSRRPAALDPVAAGVLPLAGSTALQVLDRLALSSGAWLLVHGASGGVGHLLVQLAVGRGIHVAAVSRGGSREWLLHLGAEIWVDRAEPSPAAAAAAELGHELNGVVDLVGGLLADSLSHLAEGAQAATIVDLSGDYDDALDRNISIHGILVRPGRPVLEDLASSVATGLRPTIAAVHDLADAAAAHRRLEAGSVGGKIALTVSSNR